MFVSAERTKLTVDGVEFLLMKALALHLIEGSIDQVCVCGGGGVRADLDTKTRCGDRQGKAREAPEAKHWGTSGSGDRHAGWEKKMCL